jgi:hypothetical protein
MSDARCIYTSPDGLCDASHPLHPREHYLPAGLGEFKNDKRLHNIICYGCQETFGALEDVFLHNSPEAFFRVLVGQKGRTRKKKKDIFYEPTAGMPPIGIVAKRSGSQIPVLWEPLGMFECKEMKQLVFRNKDNGEYNQLPYRPGTLTQTLIDSFLKYHRVEHPHLALYLCNKGEEEREIRTVCAHLLRGEISDAQIPEEENLEGRMSAQITLPYLRALAKVAFHFVVAHFPFSGFEPQFANIKRFIYQGVFEQNPVEMIEERLVEELKQPNNMAKQWGHVLSAQYDYDTFESRMQFFIGPFLKPYTWRVKFGKSPSRVIGVYGRGFVYRYYDKANSEGYAGVMEELQRAP